MLCKNSHQHVDTSVHQHTITYNMKENILVTGSHRSGSTWVGKVLGSGGQTLYIQEPFNVFHKKRYDTPVKYWFEYISNADTPEKQTAFKKYLKRFTSFDLFRLKEDLKDTKSVVRYPRTIFDAWHKNHFSRRLFKDPLALFSAEWLVQHFDMDVVILIRHPAAFTESVKAQNWQHDFSHFSNQKQLMKDFLQPFEADIQDITHNSATQVDTIEQGVLFWNIIHHQILYYKKKYPNWKFVRHEDLSRQPFEAYKMLFDSLDLKFSKKVHKYLKETTQADKNSRLKRKSIDNSLKWKYNLSTIEQQKIYDKTHHIARHFYTENEW